MFILDLLRTFFYSPDSSFVTVPPSLLACACLCDAISIVAPHQHRKCVELLSGLAGLEQVSAMLNVTCNFRPCTNPSTGDDHLPTIYTHSLFLLWSIDKGIMYNDIIVMSFFS